MGKRGPARKPVATLKLHGTYREDRHGNTSLAAGAPSCPSWLDGEAKAEWKRIAPILLERVGLAKVDRAMLAAFCQTWSRWNAAVKLIREEGTFYVSVSQHGAETKKKHPAVDDERECRRDLVRIGAQLGLSPSARTGIHIQEAKPAGPSVRNRKA